VDVVTHAVLGATVVYVSAPARGRLNTRERLMLGAAAAAFPDIDFVGFLIDPLVFLADWHQGPTHSVVLLPLWAVLIGAIFVGVTKRVAAFSEAVLVASLGLASHIVSDVITAYGTAVLYPLSSSKVSLGTTFVIDPLFTVVVLASLAVSLWTGRRSLGAIGLLALCGYVVVQASLQQRAVDIGREVAQAQGLSIRELSALAQPFSPFNWKLIGSNGALHYEAYLNVVGHPTWVPALPGLQPFHEIAQAYRPPSQLTWQMRPRYGNQPDLWPLIEQRWDDPRFAPFRRFAAYPSLSGVESGGGHTCVWFTDLRYDLPALPATFRYGFCRASADQPWELHRLRYFSERSRQRISP
jgi:inner membrane protein